MPVVRLVRLLRRRVARCVTAWGVAAACLAGPVAAQSPPGMLTGSVVDAASERPLPNAVVSVRRRGDSGSPLRRILTDTSGAYRIAALTSGVYLLEVRALGYRPGELVVHLLPDGAYRLSVGLQVHPVRLQPTEVRGRRSGIFAAASGTSNAGRDLARAAAQESRRQRFLSAESHVITAVDVSEAVTLAEPDIMRALQRLPGVSARDDYSAGLWTRGAQWSQTVVTFDGLPLFNGLHAAGLVSAVSPDIVGDVVLHSGAVPIGAMPGGAAGVEIATRRGTARDRHWRTAELSMLTARASAERASRDERTAAVVSARRSHFDLVPSALRFFGGRPRVVPYAFSDVAVRVDHDVGTRWRVEASGLVAGDALWGEIPGFVERTRARWGNALGRVTLVRTLPSGQLRQSVGVSTMRVDAATLDTAGLAGMRPGSDPTRCDCDEPFAAQPTRNRLQYVSVRTEWEPASSDGVRVGVEVVRQATDFRTSGPWPHESPTPGSGAERRSAHTRLSTWFDRLYDAGPLSVRAAVRGDALVTPHGPTVGVAPQLGARLRVARRVAVSATLSQTHQYVQSIAPPGTGRNAIATADMFWLAVGDGLQPARIRSASGSAEWAVDDTRSMGINLYRRHTSGLAVADPEPGLLAGRALFVTGDNLASGVELWARRVVGRWTPSVAYANATSTLAVAGRSYAAPWERRHVLRAGSAVRLGGGFRTSGQFSLASGVPFTRYFVGIPDCREQQRCVWYFPPSAGEPSAERSPALRGLDLSLDWTSRGAGTRFGFFAQAHNLLRPRQATTYLDSDGQCDPTEGRTGRCNPLAGRWVIVHDQQLRGLPRAFAAGARVTY